MIMRKGFILILAYLVVIACGLKQPVDVDSQSRGGHIFVQSQPPGALIILDGANTNKITPDTLKNVAEGMHTLRVLKDGYKAVQDSITLAVQADSSYSVSFTLKELLTVGYVYVNSEPSGAAIFVDEQNTGKSTPDTLQLAPGVHQIHIAKNGFNEQAWSVEVANDSLVQLEETLTIYQRMMFESFGNVSCEPCVASAENLEKFRSEHQDGAFALMEYYAFWPSPNDPFYKVSPNDVKERINYYSVSNLPALRANGASGVDAADYGAIVDAYNNETALQQTALALSVTKAKNGDSLQVQVEIYDFNNVLQNDQLRLFVAVSEDDIHYDTPPGSNGLKDFNFVFRRFLSDKKGDPILGDKFNYQLIWPNWNYANSHIIAFVQDISTRKIIQTTIN